MKCARCAADLPAQSQFCLNCGAPVTQEVTTVQKPVSHTAIKPPTSRKGLITAIAVAALLGLIATGYGLSNLLNKSGHSDGTRLVNATGNTMPTGALVDKPGQVSPTAPLVDQPGQRDQGPPPDVLDYLAFLKDIERQRVAIVKQQNGDLLRWSSELTARNLTAQMSDNPEETNKKTYTDFQQSINQWTGQWQVLSRAFTGKQPPASCATLRDRYFAMLGKTAGAEVSVGNAFSTAMGGDPGAALQKLSSMEGTASRDVDDACTAADQALADVCNEFKIHKEFDIKTDGGGSNPFGIGR